jgi:hypothetical protein
VLAELSLWYIKSFVVFFFSFPTSARIYSIEATIYHSSNVYLCQYIIFLSVHLMVHSIPVHVIVVTNCTCHSERHLSLVLRFGVLMVVSIKTAYLLECDLLQSVGRIPALWKIIWPPFFRVQVNQVGNVMLVCYCRMVVTIYWTTMSHPIRP